MLANDTLKCVHLYLYCSLSLQVWLRMQHLIILLQNGNVLLHNLESIEYTWLKSFVLNIIFQGWILIPDDINKAYMFHFNEVIYMQIYENCK